MGTVESFIVSVENLFKLQVCGKNAKFPTLEQEFTTMATSRIHPTYQSVLLNNGEVFKTFEEFKTYLLKNYSSKESNFQILENLYSLDFNEGESYRDFGARLDIQATNACTAVMANWAKENAISGNGTAVLDA